ncbi:MAG: glycosyltransferase family 4 protein [Brumimicrobium sp.]|nr:glycosyltransferase family 4 protein [Brumimicrobium sp.]
MPNKKIYFLQSHAIQYHSPLYDLFDEQDNIDFKVLYCSDYGLDSSGKRFHPEFGELPNWDINLVNGHTHEILRNHSFKKGIFNGFFGLVNWGIFKKLKQEKPDLLVILGWNYFSLVYAVICCKLLGIKVYVRGDNTLDFDKEISPLKKWIKKIYFGKMLFPLYNKIGYVGEKNKAYFKSYRVPDKKLIKLPQAIDNNRFRNHYLENINNLRKVRSKLNLNADFNIMFFGRLNKTKRVLDLIETLKFIKGNVELVLVGDGIEKEAIEKYAFDNEIKNYRITGFKNQLDIMDYYLTADVVVMSSNFRETWGLVINEALNFNLPLIVSNEVGCSKDLATKKNGFIYPVGETKILAQHIQFLVDHPEERKRMGEESGRIIKDYSYSVIIKNIINSIK